MKAGSQGSGGTDRNTNEEKKIFGIKKIFRFWPAVWTWWAGWWRRGRPWRGQRWGLARSWPRRRWRACSRARRSSAGSRRTPAWRWGPRWGSCTRLPHNLLSWSILWISGLFPGFYVLFTAAGWPLDLDQVCLGSCLDLIQWRFCEEKDSCWLKVTPQKSVNELYSVSASR